MQDEGDGMLVISSLKLRRRTGEVQIEAAREPVVVTTHGRPRCVVLSVEEYARLKRAASEPVPVELAPQRGETARSEPDKLGYDLSDVAAALRAMAADAISGRTRDAVKVELAAIRRRFPAKPR
jgi:prevent-host-death family protein